MLDDEKAHDELELGSSKPATNGCLELEFQVEDVDLEYFRFKQMDVECGVGKTT
jgi:hypothetical protein